VILTHRTHERKFDQAMARLVELPTVRSEYTRIRREELD
jgi:hypothetical protein